MSYEKPDMDVIKLDDIDIIRTSMEDGDWEEEDQGNLNNARRNLYYY